MKGNPLSKLYDRLTDDERFRLWVQAVARDDTTEAQALNRTCPRKVYDMLSAGFVDRMDALSEIVFAWWADMGPVLAKLDILEAYTPALEHVQMSAGEAASQQFFEGFLIGYQQAVGARPSCPACDVDDAIDDEAPDHSCVWDPVNEPLGAAREAGEHALDVVVRTHQNVCNILLAKARAFWEAFEALCQEAAVTPDDVVVGFLGFAHDLIATWRPRWSVVELPDADPAENAGLLITAWRNRTGTAPVTVH